MKRLGRIRMGEKVLTSEVSGKCPFCGLDISFGGSNSEPFAAHAVPMCEKFKQLDALQFLEACNRREMS
jgi:hypothetical protein